MIKLMREGARKYPWLLKSIMGLLAIAFIITMGWWGFGETQTNAIASIGDLSVSRDEYRRAYETIYRFYKDNVQGDFKEESLKQFAIDRLVEDKLWTVAARQMSLTVTPDELRADIISRPEFQEKGQFDPDRYRRLLAANRLTPALFESMHTAELLRQKAQTLIRESVALTPAEIAEAESLMARQSQVEPSGRPANERLLQDFLFQKQQRALMAYKDAMKARVPIKIHKEML